MARFAMAILTLTVCIATIAFAICSASSGFHNDSHSEFPAGLQLVAVGGSNSDSENIADIDVITLSSNAHVAGAPFPSDSSNFGSTVVNNTIYVVGGDSPKDFRLQESSSFFGYNVAANIWTQLPDFPFNITSNALVTVGNAIYSIGGYAQNYGFMNYTYKYDLNKRVWSKLPALLPALTIGPCMVASNTVYCLNYGDLYSTSDGANTWKQLSSMILKRNLFASCVLLPESGQIFVIGGASRNSVNPTTSVESYDIATDTWKAAASMNRARAMASATVIPGSDDVVICGGEDYHEHVTYDDCELYSAAKNQWNVLNVTLNVPRHTYGLFAIQL